MPSPAPDIYTYDGLGSVGTLVQSSGNTWTESASYVCDAFGVLISEPASAVNSYRYAGEYWDSDLGLYFLRARYYNPSDGRFITMDTFEGNQTDPLSLHKYLYCHGNPVNRVDPSGNGDYTLVSVASAAAIGASLSVARTYYVTQGSASLEDYVTSGLGGAAVGAVGGLFLPMIMEMGVGGRLVVAGFGAAAGTVQIGKDLERGDTRAATFDGILTAAGVIAPVVGGPRSKPMIVASRNNHERAVQSFIRAVTEAGYEAVGTEVEVKVPTYARGRKYDVIVRDPQTKQLGGVEIKSTIEEFNNSPAEQGIADSHVNRFGGKLFGSRARSAQIEGQRLQSAAKIYWDPEW